MTDRTILHLRLPNGHTKALQYVDNMTCDEWVTLLLEKFSLSQLGFLDSVQRESLRVVKVQPKWQILENEAWVVEKMTTSKNKMTAVASEPTLQSTSLSAPVDENELPEPTSLESLHDSMPLIYRLISLDDQVRLVIKDEQEISQIVYISPLITVRQALNQLQEDGILPSNEYQLSLATAASNPMPLADSVHPTDAVLELQKTLQHRGMESNQVHLLATSSKTATPTSTTATRFMNWSSQKKSSSISVSNSMPQLSTKQQLNQSDAWQLLTAHWAPAPKLPADTVNEVDGPFLELLDSILIRDPLRKQMSLISTQRKWILLSRHAVEPVTRMQCITALEESTAAYDTPVVSSQRRPTQNSHHSNESTETATTTNNATSSRFKNFFFRSKIEPMSGKLPNYWIDKLSAKPNAKQTLKYLESLHVALCDEPLTWRIQFIEMKGWMCLSRLLDRCSRGKFKGENELEIKREIIRIARHLVTGEIALNALMKNKNLLQQITWIQGNDWKLKSAVSELLAALCLVSEEARGHILHALSQPPEKSDSYRFTDLIENLTFSLSETEETHDALQYRINTMVLLNALVNVSEQLNERLLLREELSRRGLDTLLNTMKSQSQSNVALSTQLQMYEEGKEHDEEMLLATQKPSDKSNLLDSLSSLVKRSESSNEISAEISAILQNMSLMEVENEAGRNAWKILERFMQCLVAVMQQNSFTSQWQNALQRFNDSIIDIVGVQNSNNNHENQIMSPDILSPSLDILTSPSQEVLNSLQNEHLETLKMVHALQQEKEEMEVKMAALLKEVNELKSASPTLEASPNRHSNASKVSGIYEELNHLKSQLREMDNILEDKEKEIQFLQLTLERVLSNTANLEELAKEKKAFQEKRQQQQQLASTTPRGVYKRKTTGKEKEMEEKIEKSEKKVVELAEELEKMRQRLIELEKANAENVNASSVAAPPPPPPPGSSSVPPPPPPPPGSAPPPPPPPPGGAAPPPPPPPPGGPAPPPPPPPPGGAPPPPPPPGSGPPPPPPAPGGAPPPAPGPALPPRKKIIPSQPMKQFFWTKLPPTKVNASLWMHLQEKQVNASELENLFAKKEAPAAPVSNAAPAATLSQANAKKAMTLIDLGRANNMAIMLSRIKLTFPEMAEALLAIQDDKLSLDQLKALKQYIPTDEEIELVREYTGDVQALGQAEKYISAVSIVPRLNQRLTCMIYRRRFTAEWKELQPELESLSLALDQLQSSSKLKSILALALSVGNYLNGGSFRGEAYGFQLDALMKMKETRASTADATIPTLLHYLAVKCQEEGVVDFIEQCPKLEQAMRVSVPTLLAGIKALEQGMNVLKTELNIAAKEQRKNDAFASVMQSFVNENAPLLQELNQSATSLESKIKKVLAFYGEEEATPIESILSLFYQFSQLLQNAIKEMQEEKVKKEKAALKATSASNLKKATLNASTAATPAPGTLASSDINSAIQSLKDGTLLRQKRASRMAVDQVFSSAQPISSEAILMQQRLLAKRQNNP